MLSLQRNMSTHIFLKENKKKIHLLSVDTTKTATTGKTEHIA